ncbi:hypothetical protein STEG23_035916, partial [Scotinomys teguina]
MKRHGIHSGEVSVTLAQASVMEKREHGLKMLHQNGLWDKSKENKQIRMEKREKYPIPVPSYVHSDSFPELTCALIQSVYSSIYLCLKGPRYLCPTTSCPPAVRMIGFLTWSFHINTSHTFLCVPHATHLHIIRILFGLIDSESYSSCLIPLAEFTDIGAMKLHSNLKNQCSYVKFEIYGIF